jgi:hypothetical protein
MPVERLENGSWPHPARLPLGCGWSGHCTAPGHEGQVPQQDVLEAFCNLGYASSCQWAPRERVWDAVRFAVTAPSLSDRRKRGDLDPVPHTIRLGYVCERDHLPVQHGNLEFDLKASIWLRRHDDSRVQQMAECFLGSYLKKQSETRERNERTS